MNHLQPISPLFWTAELKRSHVVAACCLAPPGPLGPLTPENFCGLLRFLLELRGIEVCGILGQAGHYGFTPPMESPKRTFVLTMMQVEDRNQALPALRDTMNGLNLLEQSELAYYDQGEQVWMPYHSCTGLDFARFLTVESMAYSRDRMNCTHLALSADAEMVRGWIAELKRSQNRE